MLVPTHPSGHGGAGWQAEGTGTGTRPSSRVRFRVHAGRYLGVRHSVAHQKHGVTAAERRAGGA